MTDWKSDRNLGPWALDKQRTVLGYLNNPRWTAAASTTIHKPCGYWREPRTIIEAIGTPTEKRPWKRVVISTDGKYRAACWYTDSPSDGEIYVSTNYGLLWEKKGPNKRWYFIFMSPTGQYLLAGDAIENKTWRSSDYGQTWIVAAVPACCISAAFSSNGQFQTFGGPGPSKLYTSSDFGVTWTEKNYAASNVIMSTTGQYQTVSSNLVHVSVDYGVTWVSKLPWGVFNRAAMSSNGQYQSICDAYSFGIVRVSNNFGVTWTNAGLPYTGGSSWREMNMTSDGQVQVVDSTGIDLLYYSTNYGVSWTAVSLDLLSGYDISKMVMAPNNGLLLMLQTSTEQLWLSSNLGVSWKKRGLSKRWIDAAMSVTGQHQIAINNNVDNIYQSSNYGETWNIYAKVVIDSDDMYKEANTVWPI